MASKRQAYLMVRPDDQEHQKTVCGYSVREPGEKLRTDSEQQFADVFSDTGGFLVKTIGEAKRIAGILGWDWKAVTAKTREIEPMANVSRVDPPKYYSTGGETTYRDTLESFSYEAIKAQAKALRDAIGAEVHLNQDKDSLITFIVEHS